jgi:superfamily I DNA/RNA helicase
MPFEFHLPSLEEMRATPSGIEMLRMIDDDNFRSALISGCPGSGKTTVSIYRLVRLNSQKINAHLVTYQNMLVVAIRGLANVQRVPTGRVSTFHKWYWKIAQSGFNTNSPPTAEHMIDCLERSVLQRRELQEVLIDEGQDLPLCVYKSVPRFATRCFVGADNGQQVHPNHGARMEQIEESLRENFVPYRRFALGRNFRNTFETYRFARQFISRNNLVAWDEVILDRLSRANRRGPKPVVITYQETNDRNTHLRTTLSNAEGNVAILCPLGASPRNGKHSGSSVEEVYDLVREFGIRASKYHNKSSLPNRLERYIVTTFKSAKGMEFDAVIIPRVNFWKAIPEEWYVACTRARRQLFIYRDAREPQCDPIVHFDEETYDSESLTSTQEATVDTLPF